MIDLARQEPEGATGYGLEPEPTSWPAPCSQEGGWIDRGAGRTVLADVSGLVELPDPTGRTDRSDRTPELEVPEPARRPADLPPASADPERGEDDRRWLPIEDCWFCGAYRRYHAGVESPDDGPETWRPDRPPVRRPPPPRAVTDADRELAVAIHRALRVDPDLCGRVPRVRCRAGHATLSGAVGTRAARRRAAEIVRAIPGVTGVQNRLRVLEPALSGTGA